MTHEGTVFIGKYTSSFIFKGEGRLTQRSLGSINAAVQHCSDDGDVAELLVDISDCEYMDSTILGIMARWAISFASEHEQRPFLLGLPGNPLESIFERMNLTTLFHVSQDAHLTTSETLAPLVVSNQASEQDYARHLLTAHQTLADLSTQNAQEFATVIQCLKAELQAK